jgi:hypothetical protein
MWSSCFSINQDCYFHIISIEKNKKNMQLMINIKRYTIQFHSDGHLYIYECICRIKVNLLVNVITLTR